MGLEAPSAPDDDRGGRLYGEAFAAGVRPDRAMSVAQWADEFRYLSPEASAEPGRYRSERTPYLIEIMDCLSPSSPVQEVVFMKGAQVGGSESGFNWLGFIIDRCPGPTLMVQPTVALAESVSKQRIKPMIEACPTLKAKVADAKRGKDDSNTILAKTFPGGMLIMAGANSAAALRSMPIKNLFLDEEDAYPPDVDGEGAPTELAKKRTATFARKKVFHVSTPTYKGASNIERAYEESDRRRFHVPCPHCGHFQWLKWSGIRWKRDHAGRPLAESAAYLCEACDVEIPEHHKSAMLAAGKWVAENPSSPVAGFHLSALYSPLGWYSWSTAVDDWYKAQGNPNRLKVFINTVLGETFEIRGEDTPQWREIYARRETYDLATAPKRVLLLTGACDVQKDRLEVTIVGWNRKEAWVVDHIIVHGDTSQTATWLALDKVVLGSWAHESGTMMPLSMFVIDSGYNTTRVYEYVRRHNPRTVIAIKGKDELDLPIASPKSVDVRSSGKRIKRGVRLWLVGSSVLKSDIYGRLKLPKPTDEEIKSIGFPSTYIHFPQLGEEYFKQLTAEVQVLSKGRSGYSRYQWVKTHPNNEALDLVCYNLAAFYAVGANRWPEPKWKALEGEMNAPPAQNPEPAVPAPTAAQAAPPRPRPKAPRASAFWR